MELLQKWILVHSCIYYDLNANIVDDYVYDMNCKQLAEAISKFPKIHKNTKWYKAFEEFDGSTGFDLWSKLDRTQQVQIGLLAASLVDKFGRGRGI